MGRTACTEPQCLYKGDLYLFFIFPFRDRVRCDGSFVLRRYTDAVRIMLYFRSERPNASRILRKWELNVHNGEPCAYIQEVQLKSKDWNMIRRDMTAPLPKSWPSSVLPTPSSHCAFVSTRKTTERLSIVFLLFGATAQRGPRPPQSRVFWMTHNDAPQSVGLLWMSDRPVAETST